MTTSRPPGTPANAGRRSRLHANAIGPAWLRFTFRLETPDSTPMNVQNPTKSRPTYVTVAVTILAATSVFGIASSMMRGTFAYQQVVSLAVYTLGFLLAWLIFRGRNWARWVYLVLIALAVSDLLFSHAELRWRLSRPATEIAWFSFRSLLSPVAVALLFLPLSNEWFRLRKGGF